MGEFLWWWIEATSGLTVLAILWMMWRYHHPGPEKRYWRCVRYQGGGVLTTPKKMTLAQVAEWLGKTANVEIAHVDENYGFVFYRPRGG